jgi:hypothetical protein
VIGLEDLTGIRKRTKVRKKQRYKHNSWAFRELQTFIEYVGAMNIEARTRAFRHDLEVQGLVVDSPDETISSETSLKPPPTGRGN